MKSLEKGQDKIQKICDKLRQEAIEPAEEEARRIIEEAKKKAEDIKIEAQKQAERLLKQAKDQIEKERHVFNSALLQASKQTIEGLRQEIEHRFLNDELQHILEKKMSEPKVVADMINGIVKAIEKEGLQTDLTAIIPQLVSKEEIMILLLKNVRDRLKEKALEVGPFAGGAQLKLHGKKMIIDLSDQAIKELLAEYMRKDFRKFLFS